MRRLARGVRASGWWLAVSLAVPCAAAAPAGWPPYADAVVGPEGTGQFHSVQDAIAAAPAGRPDRPWIIYLRQGTYRERLYVQREKRFVALVGEDPETTRVVFDLHANLPGPDGRPIGTFRTATVQIDADDFSVEGLTIENAAGPVGQALALRVDGDRVTFRRCRFLGWQDTILVNRGRQYFADCLVSGHVDFIFGGATAFFDRCTLVARADGYLTAASTPPEQPHGLVFADGRIRGDSPAVRTYLGRPWRAFASTVFLRTEMSEVVRPEGWHNWNRPEREATVRYAEHGTRGGEASARRVPWARALGDSDAAALTPASVLAGRDGWNPAAAGSVFTATASASPTTDATSGCEAPASLHANLTYSRPGGQALQVDLCVPPGNGPFPAALLVHGGGWMGGERAQAARPLRSRLTRAGFAWLAVQYRLAPGVRYPAPVDDVVAALRWTRSQARRWRLAPDRLALLGESAGGHLVVDAAATWCGAEERVGDGGAAPEGCPAAVVALFAPVDLEADADRRAGLSASMRALLGREVFDASAREALRAASPIRRLRRGLPPFLLVHGTADMSVPFDQSTRLRRALEDLQVPCELMAVPDAPHGTRRFDEARPGWADEVTRWLLETLSGPGSAAVR